MSITVDAIYENGVLRLKEPLPLAESAAVRVTIVSEANSQESSGDAGKDAAVWLAEIAAMPMERGGEGFSGRDHDRILYGPKGAR